MERVIRFILRHGALLAMISLTSLIVPAWFVPRARIDNSLEVWMGRGSPEFSRYEEFRRRYGSDEMIIIAADMPQPLSPQAMAMQRELASALREINGIRDVTSLPDVYGAILALTPDSAAEPSEHPLIRNLLLSEDGQTVGMVAWLEATLDPESRARVVDSARRAANVLQRHGYVPHIVGAPVLNVELDGASRREATRIMPAAAVLALALMLVLFRSVTVPAVCLLATAATVLWTAALMVICGTTFNLMSVALPPLLVVLALAPGIHLALRYLNHLAIGRLPDEALRRALDELLRPIVLTTLTTAIGFASLLMTDMTPVHDVGLFAMAGIVLSLVFTLAVVPGLLRWLPMPEFEESLSQPTPHWTATAGAMAAARPWLTATLSLILLGLLGLVATQVRIETNVLSFLPAHSPIAQDYRFVSDRLTGLYTLELDITVPRADELSARAAVCRMAEVLEANPHVARVDHYGLFETLLAGHGPFARLAKPLDRLQRAAPHFRVVEDQIVHLRASILVRSMASSDFDTVIERARRQAAARLPGSARWDLTGAVLLMSRSQAALVQTQVRSFAMAIGLVLLVMGVVMRSWRDMLAAIVPNILPVVAMFALMAALRISLNPATVMIASVAIGLAVDGTIHFLASYRRAPASDEVSAARQALEKSGRPIVFTALVGAAGFSLLIMSDFAPLAEFGLLTGTTLIIAMLCDVLITPAWAALLQPRETSNAV